MREKVIAGVVIGVVVLSMLFAAVYGNSGSAHRRVAASGGKVAVIYLEGVMSAGQSSDLWSGGSAGSNITSDLRKAANSPEISAVVLRLNSPGGTPVAAQEIANEIDRLRDSGKVVVTSMGDTAASAAYWVAARTDVIVANPGTLTGSIGVIMETPNLQKLFETLGVSVDIIKSGPYKDIGSYSRPATPEERAILQAVVDDIFEQFIEAVAQGREMETEQVRQLADGRVFTGRQALEAGLVDQLGDLQDAVTLAGKLAGLKGEPEVVNYSPGNFWSSLIRGAMGDLVVDGKSALLDYSIR